MAGKRPIPGFPKYQISESGIVFGPNSPDGMKPHDNNRGYLLVSLSQGGRYVKRYVHRLVLITYVGPCPDGMVACHNNGDPKNCTLANLRWDTRQANERDKRRHGTMARGERQGSSKLSEEQVRTIIESPMSQRKLAHQYGVTQGAIWQIKQGRTWAHAHSALTPNQEATHGD